MTARPDVDDHAVERGAAVAGGGGGNRAPVGDVGGVDRLVIDEQLAGDRVQAVGGDDAGSLVRAARRAAVAAVAGELDPPAAVGLCAAPAPARLAPPRAPDAGRVVTVGLVAAVPVVPFEATTEPVFGVTASLADPVARPSDRAVPTGPAPVTPPPAPSCMPPGPTGEARPVAIERPGASACSSVSWLRFEPQAVAANRATAPSAMCLLIAVLLRYDEATTAACWPPR